MNAKPEPVRKKPSVRDVARLAGVSVATVSRALSRPEIVSGDTLDAVRTAARQLSYVAHGAGRALVSGRTRTVGAVLPTLDHAIFASTAFALQKSLATEGYLLVLACSEYDRAGEEEVVKGLIERGVDAMVLFGRDHDPRVLVLLDNFQIPCVLAWAYELSGAHPSIGFDNRASVSLLMEHLCRLGHRTFGAIGGPFQSEWQNERLSAIRAETNRRRRSLEDRHVHTGSVSYDTGRRGIRAIMSSDNPPSAVICGHDIIAVGALAECSHLGIDVPGRVSITGFEDLDVAANVVPALTTVRFPADDIGDQAAQSIVRLLAGDAVSSVELPISIRVRASTGVVCR